MKAKAEHHSALSENAYTSAYTNFIGQISPYNSLFVWLPNRSIYGHRCEIISLP